MNTTYLEEVQRLPASGARAVERFVIDRESYLAIPQLAYDIPQTDPNMNGGNSDTTVLLYRRAANMYVEHQRLPSPGGEDAEFFSLGDRDFLAIASIRSGQGPYQFAVDSVIYEWRGGRFEEFQRIPTVAAKQWRHFTIGDRHFLAIAQGVVMDGLNNVASQIYEWNGVRFELFQEIPSQWAYNWHFFVVGQQLFLAHADHMQPSVLYRWNGSRFEPFQSLVETQGRAFTTFEVDGTTYLVCARLQSDSPVFRWNGTAFDEYQQLAGSGAREFALIQDGRHLYVLRVNFILGTPASPRTALDSQIYRWQNGALHALDRFPTLGGTDLCTWRENEEWYVAVSNSLSADLRFRTDTLIYRFLPS
jgi:EPTP domain